MGTESQEEHNEKPSSKIPLPEANSTQSVLTIDTEEREEVEEPQQDEIVDITPQERQTSTESALSNQEDFALAHSPRTSRVHILQKLSMPKLGGHKHSSSKASNNSQEDQKALISDFEKQLNNNLTFLLEQKEDTLFTASLYCDLASVYQKLAKVDVLLNRDSSIFHKKLDEALEYFQKAITHADKANNKDLAEYHANRAKCYYSYNNHLEAKAECLNSMGYNKKNYTAHEVMGYIHKSEGNYELALASFEQSASDKKHNIHYIVSLYNQSITLAALGRQEEALLKFKVANTISLSKLEMEDQILAAEMHNPKYELLIKELASLSSKHTLLNSPRNASIQAMVNDIEPGSSSPSKIESYSQKLSSLVQELKEERTAHLNDTHKLTSLLLKRSESGGDDVSEADRHLIKTDTDLHAFYTEIKRRLNVTYNTTQSIGTELVENNKTGTMGDAAKALSFFENFMPVPKPLTAPVKLASLALETLDKEQQTQCIKNFNNIAEDEEEMHRLSKAVALKLTLQRKEELSKLEGKSHTNEKDIKKLAIADAENMAEFIKEIIFDGRITDSKFDSKVNTIIALVNMNQEYNDANIKELPEYTINSSKNILSLIKELAKHWHNNEDLENVFVNRLAENIHKAKIPENIIQSDKFAKYLSQTLFYDRDIIQKTHRTFKIWETKYLLKESFLSSEDYFIKTISDLSRYFDNYQNTPTDDYTDTSQDGEMKFEPHNEMASLGDYHISGVLGGEV